MRRIEELRENGSKRIATINDQPSKTDQQYKADCDANEIIRRFNKTGLIQHVSKVQAQFADVSDIPDLLEGMERIQEANDAFMQVPAKIRKRFDNSVSKFYDYIADPANDEEAIKLGLKEIIYPADPQMPPKPVAKVEEQDGKTQSPA